ncbi:MAG: flavodoxin family protein [Acidimicrobiia bacterium]
MKALVVYESMFGNTRLIAEAIAEGLSGHMEVETVEVGLAPELMPPEIDFVVIGGPTHAFGLSRPRTRLSAGEHTEGPLVSARIGIREWLEGLVPPGKPVDCASFDTRIDKPRVPGSAAASAGRRLRRLGFHVIVGPESFFVDGTTGPLLAGEYGRAHSWGELLASRLAVTTRTNHR